MQPLFLLLYTCYGVLYKSQGVSTPLVVWIYPRLNVLERTAKVKKALCKYLLVHSFTNAVDAVIF